jgi:hypothetical protein
MGSSVSPGIRAAVIVCATGALLALAACSRRSRITLPVASADPARLPTTAGWAPSPMPGVAPAPTETPSIAPRAPVSPTPSVSVHLDPLWDDLESALDDLDSALAGVENWEVALP